MALFNINREWVTHEAIVLLDNAAWFYRTFAARKHG
jgi:hypothetical protein